MLELKIALPASLPSKVSIVISLLPSVPLKIISVSEPWASIVIFPAVVDNVTVLSPAVISSNAPAPIYVFNLDKAHFLFVPPAPSSTIIKSASAKFAPISVAPSISKSRTLILTQLRRRRVAY